MNYYKLNPNFFQNRNNTPQYDSWRENTWEVLESWPLIDKFRICPVGHPHIWVDVTPQEVDLVTT